MLKTKVKFRSLLCACTLTTGLSLGQYAYATPLPKDTVSINGIHLNKNAKVNSTQDDNVKITYDSALANYVVSIQKPEKVNIIDVAEELNHDRIKLDSNFILNDLIFPVGDVGKIIVNNSLQYITIESNKNSKNRFTLSVLDTQTFCKLRISILEIYNKSLRKFRESDEILDEFTVNSINENSKVKAKENLLSLKFDGDRVILRLKNELSVEKDHQVVRRISCDLTENKSIKGGCHQDSYMVLDNLKDYTYKNSRVENISRDNQPQVTDTGKVNDWTILALDKLSEGELDSSFFEMSIGEKPINTKDLNLCFHVTYSDKNTGSQVAGLIDFIRIRNDRADSNWRNFNLTLLKTLNYKLISFMCIAIMIIFGLYKRYKH